MQSTVSPSNVQLSDFVCCPQCHGNIDLHTGCANCGATCGLDGPIINFNGRRAYLLDDASDLAMATWLLEHLRDFEKATVQTYANRSAQSAEGDVSSDNIQRLVRGSSFHQILNDIRRIQDGIDSPSSTVDFMLKNSTIGTDSVVLDVGCSAGRHMWEIRGRSPRILAGVDIQLLPLAVGALVWGAQAAPCEPLWCCANALNLPFKDGVFTQIHSFVTLSEVPICMALAELSRILAPNGQLLVTIEGNGFWRRRWDESMLVGRSKFNLLRAVVGERLLRHGFDWQRLPLLRRLSGHNEFTRPTIERVISRAGFVIDECQVLDYYRGHPLLLGLNLRKRLAD